MKSWALLLVLFFSPHVFATSYTSSQSGDFNSNSTWGGAGHPRAGDTWTVSGGTTVTCSQVCASGQAAQMTCTVDGTVDAGGNLTIAGGGTLTHSGALAVQHNGTLSVNARLNAITSAPATLTIAPGNGAICGLNFVNVSQGTPNLNLIGAPGPPGHNVYVVLDCNTALDGGAGCTINPDPGGDAVNLTFDYFQLTGFGNATLKAFSGVVANSINIQNGLFNRDGDVYLSIGECSTCNFIVRNVSFTNPTDVSASGNPYTAFEFYGTAAPTGGTRSLLNVTAATQRQTQRYGAYVGIVNLQTGESTLGGDPVNVNGFVGYNVYLSQGTAVALSNIFRSNAVVMDMGGEGIGCYSFLYDAALTFQDSFCLARVPNQHEIVSGATATGSANLYQRYLCDGDGFFNYDTGDMIQDWGTYTMKNSIGINLCGTMTTISMNSSEVATVIQNTNFNNFGETYCESACYDGIHPVFTNNLLVKPADVNGTGIRGDDGLHAAFAFERQTNFALDYNGFYQMPGSGDPGAEVQPPVPALLPNPALGGIISYVNVPAAIVGNQAQKVITAVTDPEHIGCSSCNFTQQGAAGVMPGDYFEDNGLLEVVTVASVTDSTHLVLTSPGITGMRPGEDMLTVYTSYWNHRGWYYGDANNGSHDIHANPLFVDSSRTLCGWYKANTNASLSCPTYGSIMAGTGVVLVATTGTGGTTLNCNSCNFPANGITTADVVQVYVGTDDTVRGWSTISAVTAQSLSLNMTIPNLAPGDEFDFITSTQGLGKILVQSAGFDWNGNPVVPPSWATAANAMSYIYSGFTPQNLIYRGAGSPADGFPDIGAVAVNPNR